MTKLKFRITFTDDLLGTCSGNADIHREFIASKAPDAQKIEDEVAALGVEGVEEKTMTKAKEGHIPAHQPKGKAVKRRSSQRHR